MSKYVYFLKKNIYIILLSLILILGFTLRIYGLGIPSMWIDESISSIVAEKITEKGLPILDSGEFYGRALVFHYLMAFFMLIFSGDFGARFISVIFGLATIILAYYIGKEYDKPTGLIAALFTAVFFLEVWYSRQSRFYQMFQFLFFLTIFFLIKVKGSKGKKYTWLSTISFLILLDTHIAGLVIAPLLFYVLIKDQKDKKMLVFPLIITAYYGLSFLTLPISREFTTQYINQYSSGLFHRLRAFALISLIGLPFAYLKNRKITLFAIIPSLLLIFGLFYLDIFALRYAYFIVLLFILLIAVLLSFLYKNSKILFVIVIIFALIYPSNLFFPQGNLTQIKPEIIDIQTFSEPVLDYKLSEETKLLISNSKSLVLFTPSFARYHKNPDYYVPFSLSGLGKVDEEIDDYTGAHNFNFSYPQISEFIYIEDEFGYSKLSETQRIQINKLKKSCNLVEKTKSVKVYSCLLK